MAGRILDLSRASLNSRTPQPNKDFIIDGYPFWPPPETCGIQNNYRVTVKQVGAGQVADAGGLGGCEINLRGKVPERFAGWLAQVEERCRNSAETGEVLLFTDPRTGTTYEAVCTQHVVDYDAEKPTFYQYAFILRAQIAGESWTFGTPLTEAGALSVVPAFDQDSIDDVLADAERIANDYKQMGASGNGEASNAGKGTPYEPDQNSDGSSVPTTGTRTHTGGTHTTPGDWNVGDLPMD